MSAEKNEDSVSLRGQRNVPGGHSRVPVHTQTHTEIQTAAAQSWLKHFWDSREADFYNADVRERERDEDK